MNVWLIVKLINRMASASASASLSAVVTLVSAIPRPRAGVITYHHHGRRRCGPVKRSVFCDTPTTWLNWRQEAMELGETRRRRCKAMEPSDNTNPTAGVTYYQGIYGPWTIEPSDVREVVLYRAGLVAAASSFVLATSTAFLPHTFFLTDLLDKSLDFLYLLGAAGLGLSLFLIHIYVTEIKRTLQALWFLGAFGSLTTYITLARPAGLGLVQYVVDNPTAVWFIGPLFASLTGLVIKEGLCYGKLEAAFLAFIIPTCLLGHLTGTMDNGVKMCLLGLWVAFFAIFSGRKFTQPLKDDIGDKSVFMFKALPQEEKKALLERSGQQKF